MREFFHGHAKYWYCSQDYNMGKQKAIKEISDFFCSSLEESTTFLLLYSGHGTPPTEANQGGNWIFTGGVLSLEEVLRIWSLSSAFQSHRFTYLVLVIDACFSGCWVERLKDLKFGHLRVAIQASTKADQVSEDTRFGAAFLCYWTKRQLDEQVRLMLPHTGTFSSTFETNPDFVKVSERVCLHHHW